MEIRIVGLGASEGVAFGPIFVHKPAHIELRTSPIDASEIGSELVRYQAAVAAVVERLRVSSDQSSPDGDDQAEILGALLEMAQDPDLANSVEQRVRSLEPVEFAVIAAGEEFATSLERLSDEYLAARAGDVRDVARQIAIELAGTPADATQEIAVPSIVFADNLGPSETLSLPSERLLGLVTRQGSVLSHVAILARSIGIPAVVGAATALDSIDTARSAAMDGTSGVIILDPEASTLDEFNQKIERVGRRRLEFEAYSHVTARTSRGQVVEVAANAGSLDEAITAFERGADGIGLFRTELMFMQRPAPPNEEEQYEIYRRLAEQFGTKPVIIRTLDIGGDKAVLGVESSSEANPFLGWRGIRMSLDSPQLFDPQLRAILRAAVFGNVKVMFPMVADQDELVRARKRVEECRSAIHADGGVTGHVDIGVMIETPAAALCADRLAPLVDFFSIGTNDLVQYTMAADRGNARLRHLHNARHPAVVKLVEHACTSARSAGIWVGVCGEAASDPELIQVFVDLGVRELSINTDAISKVKSYICTQM